MVEENQPTFSKVIVKIKVVHLAQKAQHCNNNTNQEAKLLLR